MRTIAFPSWVTAGNIAQNAAFICGQWQEWREKWGQEWREKQWEKPSQNPLQNLDLPAKLGPDIQRKPEIGLCFFEHAACTAYTNEDLPQQLASLPASWHVHLPLDLPFYTSAGLAQAQQSFDICNELMQKVEFLGVKRAVLHPVSPPVLNPVLGRQAGFKAKTGAPLTPHLAPASSINPGSELLLGEDDLASASLFKFINLWENSGRKRKDLLLENQPGDDLFKFFNLAKISGCGVCLDLAHLYMKPKAYALSSSANLLTSAELSVEPKADQILSSHELDLLTLHCPQMVQMVHINAPGQNQSGHASLASLLPEVHKQYQSIISALPKNSTLMLELFKWQQVEESIPFLLEYLSCCD